MSEDVVEEYLSSLSDLTVNSKPLINVLTMLADENVEHAPAIVEAIEKHISKIPPETKLPVLYLIDSIIKNVERSYLELFTLRIVNIFVNVFEKVDDKTKANMFKLRQTWNDVFPNKKLYDLDMRVNKIDPGWPVTATPSSIHVNPKFLAKKHAAKVEKVAVAVGAAAAQAVNKPLVKTEVDERTAREKILHQKMLLELEQKKLELEMLEAKLELKRKAQSPEKINVNQDIVSQITLPSVITPQAVILPPSVSSRQSASSSLLNLYTGQKVKIAPANTAIIQSVKMRDPRLARRSQPPQPTLKEREIYSHQLAMLKAPVVPQVAPTLPLPASEVPILTGAVINRRRTEKENKRVEHVRKHSSSEHRSSVKRSEAKSSNSGKSHKSSPTKKHSSSKHRDEEVTKRTKSPGSSPTVKNKEPTTKKEKHVSASDKSERRRLKKEKSESEILVKKKKSKHEKGGGKEKKHKETEKVVVEEVVVEKKKEKVMIEEKPVVIEEPVIVVEHQEIVVDDGVVDMDIDDVTTHPTNDNQIVVEDDDGNDDDADQDVSHHVEIKGFKELKGKVKSRQYMRRNREQSNSPTPATTLNENDIKLTESENLVNVSGKDVDLRQLASPSKKRLTDEDGEDEVEVVGEPPKKKNKPSLDSLFGSEDVDLRQMAPAPLLLPPSPPPPPVISAAEPEPPADECVPDPEPRDVNLERHSWADIKAVDKDDNMDVSMDISEPESEDKHTTQSDITELDKLGRPLLYNRLPKDPRLRRESLNNVQQCDTDMRRQAADGSADVNVKKIIEQTEERLRNGTLSSDERNQVLSQVVQLNEYRKLREAQRMDDLDQHPGYNRRRPVSSSQQQQQQQYGRRNRRSPDVSEDDREREHYRDVDERARGRWRMMNRNQQDYQRPYRRGPRNMYEERQHYQSNQHSIAITPAYPVTGVKSHNSPPPVKLPPADPQVVELVRRDAVKSLLVEGSYREVRYYSETAVVFFSDHEPKEIAFNSGERDVMITPDLRITCSLNGPYETFKLGDNLHRVRLGGPTRELYIDGQHYSAYFGGDPVDVTLDDVVYPVSLQAPPPSVHIGRLRHDLVAGRVNAVINAKEKIPIYLDSKPQLLNIDNTPIILRFVNSLTGVLLNEVELDVEFNGSPKPILVNGRRHYLRLSALPPGVEVGKVTLQNMENRVLSSSRTSGGGGGGGPGDTTTADTKKTTSWLEVKPSHLLFDAPVTHVTVDVAAQREKDGLDFLTSLMPASSLPEQSCGFGYKIEPADTEMKTESVEPEPAAPILNALQNVNIDALFQGLIASGFLSNPVQQSQTSNETDNQVYNVDLNDANSMRKRQPGVIHHLYTGIQCNTCGVRFKSEDTLHYSQHLDWHFRQNRREKDSLKKAQSRKWYFDVSDWIQFEEIENLEERAQSWFETEASANQALDDEVEVVPCVAAPAGSVSTCCEVCLDKFELFFNEDNEEWELKCCIVIENKYYHPVCYKDMVEQSLKAQQESNVNENQTEDDSVAIIDDKPDEDDDVVELPKEVKINEEITLDDSAEDDENCLEAILSGLLNIIVDEELREAREAREAEELRLKQERELEELGFTSVPVEPKKKISDEEFYERVDDEIQMHYDPPENYVPAIKIKQEPIDEMESVASGVDQTLVNVISSIDGNVELTDTPPLTQTAPSKIKINLNKPVNLENNVEKFNIQVINNNSVEDVEQEKLLPLKPKKPGLAGRELTAYPTVERGREVSGLCSIM